MRSEKAPAVAAPLHDFAADVPGQILLPGELGNAVLPRDPKTRLNGEPRTFLKAPVRSFRCDSTTWALADLHAANRGISIGEWLRHAIERHAAEETRQAEYANKKAAAAGKTRNPKPRRTKGGKKG